MAKDKRKLIGRLGIVIFISLIFSIGTEIYFQTNQTDSILIPEIHNILTVYSFVGIVLLVAIIFYFLITVKTRTNLTNTLRTIALVLLSTISAVGIFTLIISLVALIQTGSTFSYEEERYAYIDNSETEDNTLELYKLNSLVTMEHIETITLPYSPAPNMEASSELAQIILEDLDK